MSRWDDIGVDVLLGKTLSKVSYNGCDEILFVVSDDEVYKMYHDQDCCESVVVEDICDNLS